MRNLPSPRPHNAVERAVTESRRLRATHRSPELITDGVMAGYIHEISSRHGTGNGTLEPWQRRRRGDQR